MTAEPTWDFELKASVVIRILILVLITILGALAATVLDPPRKFSQSVPFLLALALLLLFESWLRRRRLDCSTEELLAASYAQRARMTTRADFALAASAIALIQFSKLTDAVGVLIIIISHQALRFPSKYALGRTEKRLRKEGCKLSLIDALKLPHRAPEFESAKNIDRPRKIATSALAFGLVSGLFLRLTGSGVGLSFALGIAVAILTSLAAILNNRVKSK